VTENEMSAIGIIAPSGIVPSDLLEMGVKRLSTLGIPVYVHPQVHLKERYFAGSDVERALAFLDYAYDEEVDLLWAARGGFGVIRILPILDELVKRFGKPKKKRLFGFSDVTLLLEYVRVNWGWEVVHAPMPATKPFLEMKTKEWKALASVTQKKVKELSYSLKPIYVPEASQKKGAKKPVKSASKVEGKLLGGNSTLMSSSAGTPYAFQLKGSILFIEEVTEAMYSIDRDLQQSLLAGVFNGVKGIVLGTFSGCEDKPIPGFRKPIPQAKIARILFAELGEALQVPVWGGLRVGHGNEGSGVLPLGARARIEKNTLTLQF
jgi:muramoyltetrapeptide carboxypeptidase